MISTHRNVRLVRGLIPEFMSAGGGIGPTYVAGPDITITGLTIGRSGNVILLYDAGGAQVAEFAATGAGFELASAVATAGDTIYIQSVSISDDHVLVAGVHYVGVSRFGTIFTGQITGSANASLENCSITRSANDANALYGAIAPATGTFYLSRVHVSVTQAGAGNAAAIYSNAGGDMEIWNCSLLAPVGGVGWHYGVYLGVSGNVVYVEGGVCIGATGATNWSP